MPYSGANDPDLPDSVKELPEEDRKKWVATFNSVLDDCEDTKEKCESSAFAIAWSQVKKESRMVRNIRRDDYPAGQLCPYSDCHHDLAIPAEGWYKCGACGQIFYARDSDSDFEDYVCYRADHDDLPEKPEQIPVAEDLGESWASPEKESIMQTKKVSFTKFIEDTVRRLLNRKIKEVASWDGSASNYKDTAAYCSACLIDVNQGDTKTQDHCMLPVREAGDGADTYVKQAIHAAAGGHGISEVKKPDDVPQEAWDAAVKAAANKIIAAYDEMGEQAPDTCYQMAGKEVPKKESKLRAVSLDEAFYNLMDQAYKADEYAWVNGVFLDGDSMFAVISSNGKLYRADVALSGDQLTLADKEAWIEVKLDFPPVQTQTQSRTTIHRQSDGKFRWFSISCSSVLNRVGQLDSRALFDSFIAHAEETGEYPIRQFFHAGGKFRTGQCDFLARDDYLLLTSGVYDDSDIARAEVKARTANPEYWGDSIGFDPTKPPQEITVSDGVVLLAFDEGIIREISTLPEDCAAAWFTATPTIKEVNRMLTPKQYEAFVVLFDGSKEAADKWLEENSATRNRSIENQGLVTRENKNEAPTTEEPETTQPEQVESGEPAEFVITDEAFADLVQRVGNGLADQTRSIVGEVLKDPIAQIEQLRASIETLTSSIDTRLKALEAGDEEKREVWLQDAPKITVRKLSRPRVPDESAPVETEPETMQAQAEAILDRLPAWGPKVKK